MKRLYIMFLTMFTLLPVISAIAQNSQSIDERIDQQRIEFPQEKIHVMTDRGSYLAGDTIWFRAWVVDAMTHQQVNASQFVYVELVSPTGIVKRRIKIHPDDEGVFRGYLPLDFEMAEGRYQLTAYTMFMQSVGDHYFYRQPIDVKALAAVRRRIVGKCLRYKNEIDVTLRYENANDSSLCAYSSFAYQSSDSSWITRRFNHRTGEEHITLKGDDARMGALLVSFDSYSKYITLPSQETLDVTFYPEGGYLIPDVENLVTFKIKNTNPNLKTDVGELVDKEGHVIAPLMVEHDGMGLVKFTPATNATYTARWKDNFDQDVTVPLPLVRHDATVLQVSRKGEDFITIRASGAKRHGALIVLQERGDMIMAGYDSIVVRDSELPTGVVQAMLFDNEMHCLSERLFFANGSSPSSPQVNTDRNAYNDRERVKVSVDLSQFAWDKGNYAVSVIDGKSCEPSEDHILANLLLQSELRGHINQPDYYFNQDDSIDKSQQRRHLDMLMLTQGWRRYDIPRALRGLVAQPQYPIEKSQVVSGRVLSEWRKKPVAGANISLIAPRVDFSAITSTDSLGAFSIAMPLLPDSTECIVMAQNPKGKKMTNLILDTESFPQTCYYVTNEKKPSINADETDEQSWRLEKSGDWRHIMLNELMVTAIRPRKNTRNPNLLDQKMIKEKDIRSIEAATRAFPGVTMLNGDLYTTGGRGIDKIHIFVDGEPVAEEYNTDDYIFADLNENNRESPIYNPLPPPSQMAIAESMVSMQDVEYMYFVRGVHGGQLFIQRKPNYGEGGQKEPSVYLKITIPMGIQQPVEYYSPRYDQGHDGHEPGTDLRTLLYWNPRVSVNGDGTSTFDFYTSDVHNTNYIITIEGIAADGTPFRATRQLTKR